MARTYKEVTRTDRYLASTTCDVCGGNIPVIAGDFDEVTMERRVGMRCPDGGDDVRTTFDACGACWAGKVVPFMASLGAKPATSETSW